jgi:hypothetical protein
MMIDWFVVLAPLAAAPVVLLFVFLGCPVTEFTIWEGPSLSWGGGFNSDIDKIDVTASYFNPDTGDPPIDLVLQQGDPPIDRAPGQPFTCAGLAAFFDGSSPINFDISKALYSLPDIEVSCTCRITEKNTPNTITLSATRDLPYVPPSTVQEPVRFILSRIGPGFAQTDFDLTIAMD